MMRFSVLTAALWAAFILTAPFARAERIEAEGIASLDAGKVAARKIALEDAVHQAALTQGARIASNEQLGNGGYAQSGRVEAEPLRGQVQVIGEYARDGLYHVHIAVDDKPKETTRVAESSSCASAAGRPVKRRLITTYFMVENPSAASDMPALATFLPSEFARRLARIPRFAAFDTGNVSVLPERAAPEPAAGAEVVREIGRRENAQFVISGRVLDTSVTRTGIGYSVLNRDPNSHGTLNYNGPLAGFLGGSVKVEPKERQFDFEVWVYDAFTGVLLARERFSDTGKISSNRIGPGITQALGSKAFWRTDYGNTISQLINQATGYIDQQLACIPFMARVARVEGTRRLFFNGGGLDGLQIGDNLLIYTQRPLSTIRSAGNGRELGVPELLSGDATIVQLQPDLAIAEVRSSRFPVQAGDLLRFIPRH
jgi:hypothetical protein